MSDTYNYRAKKIVAVLANNVQAGVALNVIGHMCISLGRYAEADLMGREKLPDASGANHFGIAKYPVIVTQVKMGTVRKAIVQGRQNPRLLVIDYPRQMLDTGHDDELAAAIALVSEESIEYIGALIYGPAVDVDAITGKYSLWR